jgi:hypothetical protein
MRYSDLVAHTRQTECFSISKRGTLLLYIYLDYYIQYSTHAYYACEKPQSLATTILLALQKRLHHFETNPRWVLLVLLSGRIGGPGGEHRH